VPPQKIHVCVDMAEKLLAVETMTGLPRIALAFFVCGLMPLAGCTRTSDGTVIIKKPPAISTLLPSMRFMRPRPAKPVAIAATQFPPPPRQQTAGASRPRVVMTKINLDCLEQSQPGNRVRIVCK
jgi:hypothetical protein